MTSFSRPAMRRQRGTSLLEALVAFLVLSLGMLAVARLQTQFRHNADVARQRSEAVRVAQQEVEQLRAFSVMSATAGARSYADITPASTTRDDAATQPGSNTVFTVTRTVSNDLLPHAKAASVRVAWGDRGGAAQQVSLDTVIAGVDPAYSGALGVAPSNVSHKGARARSATIPLLAKDLGNGTSVLKPVAAGGVAWIFDNRAGGVTARCANLSTTSTTATLTVADLSACDAVVGLLLSGRVRFSTASPPDPAQASGSPLAVGVALALSGGSYPAVPQCASEAQKTVLVPTANGPRPQTVPLDAGGTGWTETGDRFVSYHCVVFPLANRQWSGRSTLVPSGWTLGVGVNDWRVCRFSADLDRSGSIDANDEHPAAYTAVDGPLAEQNFLVVKGNEACPASPPGATSHSPFIEAATVAHQP